MDLDGVRAHALGHLGGEELGHGRFLEARLATILKAAAWGLLALGAAGAVITPLLHLETPTLQDACVMAGFAVLIVRTRVKETMDGQPQESDDFTQTRVFHAGKK
jgi:hypothetical protein